MAKSLLRRLLANGYSPKIPPKGKILQRVLIKEKAILPGASVSADRYEWIFLFPSLVSRSSEAQLIDGLLRFAEELGLCNEVGRGLGVAVLQISSDVDFDSEGLCLRVAKALQEVSKVPVEIVITNGRGKVESINYAIDLANEHNIPVLGWMDDDVWLEAGSISRLYSKFKQLGLKGSVGARKQPHPKGLLSSKLLHGAKSSMTTPATRYPHGCCMMVEVGKFEKGIPRRYCCDDGYVCFELINPRDSQPQRNLVIVEEAVCHHSVGGTWPEIYRRVRRSIFSVLIYWVDYPPEVGSYYFKNILFFGLWPYARFDNSRGFLKGIRKAILKSIYFFWISTAAIELILRGLLGRPMPEIAWSGYTWYRPETGEGGV